MAIENSKGRKPKRRICGTMKKGGIDKMRAKAEMEFEIDPKIAIYSIVGFVIILLILITISNC